MRERSPPALFHRPDGINAANVPAVTLLFRLVEKIKTIFMAVIFSPSPSLLAAARCAQMKAANLQIFIHVPPPLHLNSKLCAFVAIFKAPVPPKIFKYRLTKKQQFGATRRGYYLRRATARPR